MRWGNKKPPVDTETMHKFWHQWYAWYPVTLTGTTEKVWLEYIWRKGTLEEYFDSTHWIWDYSDYQG